MTTTTETVAPQGSPPLLPDWVCHVLSRPDELELLTLDPDSDGHEGPDAINGYRVLNRVDVRSQEARNRVGSMLVEGNRKTYGRGICYDSDWGFRAVRGRDVAALSACFVCGVLLLTGSRIKGPRQFYEVCVPRRETRFLTRHWYAARLARLLRPSPAGLRQTADTDRPSRR